MDAKLMEVRAKADSLGIAYHHRASIKTIEGNINAHVVAQINANKEDNRENTEVIHMTSVPAYTPPISEIEYLKQQARLEGGLAGSLVRVRIQNMNPQKKEWPGEIISVGSAKLGTFKKFIPFNTGEPYHVPRIIFNELKNKQCSQFYTVNDGKGHKYRKSKLINEYVIEELDPLTPEELKDLALKQAMAEGKQG